jgi:superfamily II RNA helicase
LLFATETFAVGINMPTKTVIFTSLIKFDGTCLRNLYPHEYTQMAGRAGRRGLDKKGVVIHCNNLFNLPTSTEYKQILCGRPQSIRSKFNISYGLLLSVIASGATNFDNVEAFVNQSLVKREINDDLHSRDIDILKMKKDKSIYCKSNENMITDKKIIEEYLEIEKQIQMVKPKKRKHMKQQLVQMEDENRTLKRDLEKVKHIMTLEQDTHHMSQERDSVNEYLRNEIENVAFILQEKGFIEKNNDMFSLTPLGNSASQIKESHPLALSNILHNTDMFKDFSAADIACLLSIFTNIRIPEEFKSHTPNTFVNHIDEAAITYSNFIVHYENMELSKHIQMNETRDFTFDLMQDVMTWCNDVHDAPSCHLLIESIKNRGIFLGDFVKAILKINNVAAEIEKAAEIENNIPLLEKLKEIPLLTLKYVVSNQSLYI